MKRPASSSRLGAMKRPASAKRPASSPAADNPKPEAVPQQPAVASSSTQSAAVPQPSSLQWLTAQQLALASSIMQSEATHPTTSPQPQPAGEGGTPLWEGDVPTWSATITHWLALQPRNGLHVVNIIGKHVYVVALVEEAPDNEFAQVGAP